MKEILQIIKKNGYGKLENIILGQHSIYEGEFINDKKHGIGTLEIKGNIITGKWENDVIGKYGIIKYKYKYKSNSIYEGEIKEIGSNFIKDGFGLLKDKNKQELYIGLFKNDLKDGFGIHQKRDQEIVYIGIFRNDVLGCYGIIINLCGKTIYKGEINNWKKKWIWNIRNKGKYNYRKMGK